MWFDLYRTYIGLDIYYIWFDFVVYYCDVTYIWLDIYSIWFDFVVYYCDVTCGILHDWCGSNKTCFAEYCLFYRALLQKRPIILWRDLTHTINYMWCRTWHISCLHTSLAHTRTPRVSLLLHPSYTVWQGEVGGWGRDPKKCTGSIWGMGSSTI